MKLNHGKAKYTYEEKFEIVEYLREASDNISVKKVIKKIDLLYFS